MRAIFSFLLVQMLIVSVSCTKQKSMNPALSGETKGQKTAALKTKDAALVKPRLCLNMIVKNEAHIIRRCLDSVLPIIDYWVIVDTGSTDNTIAVIKDHLKNIPGEIYQRPWKNWGASRTEAFELAKGKGEYILFMDADDILSFQGDPELPELTKDQYRMWRGYEGMSYEKPQIVKGDLPWRWVGVTHEYLDCPVPHVSEMLDNVRYVTFGDGAESKNPEKFLKNVKLLEDGLKEEPNNDRYTFYLAESYRDSGQKAKALEYFQKRVDLGGWDEEIFWSKLQIAHMLRDLGLPLLVVVEAYKDAHSYRPHRAEAAYYIAATYNDLGRHEDAYAYIKMQESIEKPLKKDALFNVDWIEAYGLLFQKSICAYYVGQYKEALEACDLLLTIPNLPASWRERTEENRLFPLEKLKNKNLK